MDKKKVALTMFLAVLLLITFQSKPVSAVYMENWYAYWLPGGTESGSGISADDVDNDGIIEIVSVGFAWGADGLQRASLDIWNYDGITSNFEASQYWYIQNNTAAYEVFIKDVDGDGVKEILTVGKAMSTPFSTYAQLRIWNWDGATLTLEHSEEWIGEGWSKAYDVYAEDVDGDGTVEIVTVGSTDWQGQLRIWSWDGVATLTLEHSEEWDTDAAGASLDTEALAIFVEDVEGDGVKEIVTAGIRSEGAGGFPPHLCQLRIWNWDGATLTLEMTAEWKPGLDPFGGNLVGVFVDDVDDDGDKEIVSAGRAHDGTYWNGYLIIQTWDGSTLATEKEEKWYDIGDTEAFGLYIKDVEGDVDREIVTVGALHVTPGYGQIRAYTWIGGVPTWEWSEEWYSGPWGDANFAYDNYVEDVDGDGFMEILTIGRLVENMMDRAFVTIWSFAPPVANADGPYAGFEGSPITFDGTFSYDPDGTIVSYEWDLDGDGAYDDATGPTPSYTWGDDYSGTIGLRVTDNDGFTDTDFTTVTVNNVDPTADAGPDQEALPGHQYTEFCFTGKFTDPGWLDTHTAEWDFGDGTTALGSVVEENNPPDSTGTVDGVCHQYWVPYQDTYTVTLTVWDDDGGVDRDTLTVTILRVVGGEEVPLGLGTILTSMLYSYWWIPTLMATILAIVYVKRRRM